MVHANIEPGEFEAVASSTIQEHEGKNLPLPRYCGEAAGIKCHRQLKFCLGYEKDKKLYCYGNDEGCNWIALPNIKKMGGDCHSDSECNEKYNTKSPKFLIRKNPADSMCAKLKGLTKAMAVKTVPDNWPYEACRCKQCSDPGIKCSPKQKFCVGFEQDKSMYCYGNTSEVITPRPITPTFGYTKENPPHSVGSWLHDVRRDVSW